MSSGVPFLQIVCPQLQIYRDYREKAVLPHKLSVTQIGNTRLLRWRVGKKHKRCQAADLKFTHTGDWLEGFTLRAVSDADVPGSQYRLINPSVWKVPLVWMAHRYLSNIVAKAAILENVQYVCLAALESGEILIQLSTDDDFLDGTEVAMQGNIIVPLVDGMDFRVGKRLGIDHRFPLEGRQIAYWQEPLFQIDDYQGLGLMSLIRLQ